MEYRTKDGKEIQTVETFVLEILEGKKNGYFVEIGAYHSKHASNTYHLETSYDWDGVAVEIVEKRANEYNENRKAHCIAQDASKVDYRKYFFDNNWPTQLDFLTIDVDWTPQDIALHTLINLPLSTYRFNVIIFEHASVFSIKNKKIRELSEYILDSYGYTRIIEDGVDDIWVDPTSIDSAIFNPLRKQVPFVCGPGGTEVY
jgi:hypothetical protein